MEDLIMLWTWLDLKLLGRTAHHQSFHHHHRNSIRFRFPPLIAVIISASFGGVILCAADWAQVSLKFFVAEQN
jgi:hypothetical protein